MKLAQITTALPSLSETDLLQIHKDVTSLLNAKHRARQAQATASFTIKDVVQFKDRYERTLRGVVEKINTKTIRVRTETGLYVVSPTLLSKVA